MFEKKKEICCICNQSEGEKKILEGMICKNCISRCGHFLLTLSWKGVPAERVRQAIRSNEINARNLSIFHVTNKHEKFIELDENNRLWKVPCFAPNLVFSYDEIIDYELLQDGEAITKGGLGSAVVGGALFGGVGALVGSNVGAKKTKQKINEYRIKVTTKNMCYPEIYINFLTAGPIKSNSILYKASSANAQRILSLLAIITSSQGTSTASPATSNAADEIRNYKKLLDEGIITQEEFDLKKSQLLNL